MFGTPFGVKPKRQSLFLMLDFTFLEVTEFTFATGLHILYQITDSQHLAASQPLTSCFWLQSCSVGIPGSWADVSDVHFPETSAPCPAHAGTHNWLHPLTRLVWFKPLLRIRVT